MVDELTLEDAEQVLAAQPFSQLLGARVLAFGPGHASLGLQVQAHHTQQLGYVHGGVIAYLADNTLTFAGGSVLGPNVLTAGFAIELLAPVRDGQLMALATVVNSADRRATCRVDVYAVGDAGERRLCAAAQGTIVMARAS